MNCGPEEFPVSNVALALNGGALDISFLSQPIGFLGVEYQKYLFRNRLAQQFVTAISGSQSRKKLTFSFEAHSATMIEDIDRCSTSLVVTGLKKIGWVVVNESSVTWANMPTLHGPQYSLSFS